MNKQAKAQYKALPDFVKIGQRDYSIITSSEDRDATLSSAHAYTMLNHDTVVINDNLSAGKLRSTLLHELLHAVGIVAGNPEAKVPKQEKEEAYSDYADRWEHYFLYLLSEPIVELLRDNPKLIAFFTLPRNP